MKYFIPQELENIDREQLKQVFEFSEIRIANFEPKQGSEEAGVRPTIIFQNDTISIDLLQKSKTHPPLVPPSFGGKPEKLGSLTATSGRVGEGSGAFLQSCLMYTTTFISIPLTTILHRASVPSSVCIPGGED